MDRPDTTPALFKLMLQALLIDRFGLALHHESRELPVYYLSVAPKGTKLKEITLSPDQKRGGIAASPRDGGYALRQIGVTVADIGSNFRPYNPIEVSRDR